MKLPKCCGKTMAITHETNKFMELWCDNCDDIVYVKKEWMGEPQMIID